MTRLHAMANSVNPGVRNEGASEVEEVQQRVHYKTLARPIFHALVKNALFGKGYFHKATEAFSRELFCKYPDIRIPCLASRHT